MIIANFPMTIADFQKLQQFSNGYSKLPMIIANLPLTTTAAANQQTSLVSPFQATNTLPTLIYPISLHNSSFVISSMKN
jgi:hypothetical protein